MISRRRFLRTAGLAGAGLYLAPSALGRAAPGAAPSRVAVIGGGVAGLTAAHELAQRGFAVTVFERKARWVPPENEPLKRADAERWKLGLPHVLDTPWVTAS